MNEAKLTSARAELSAALSARLHLNPRKADRLALGLVESVYHYPTRDGLSVETVEAVSLLSADERAELARSL